MAHRTKSNGSIDELDMGSCLKMLPAAAAFTLQAFQSKFCANNDGCVVCFIP
jgi:hypothetical protein